MQDTISAKKYRENQKVNTIVHDMILGRDILPEFGLKL